ncbi:Cyclin-dependent kinase inhibitor [Artemisia annua]|nr:Cyclin-dependent kinase inhibitor [Artemisia annua]
MGKYMRKSKLTTGDVIAVIDLPQSTLGVRTRAKTLALQKLQTTPERRSEPSYLQLRSRRLEKPPVGEFKEEKANPRLVDLGVIGSQFEGEEEEIEGSFGGENNVDGRERSTRESTPCSFIRDSNAITTPGSSTRPTHAANRIIQNSIQRIMPSAQEIEDFFARHALEQQRRFSEK